MTQTPAIDGISDPSQVRVGVFINGKFVHAPLLSAIRSSVLGPVSQLNGAPTGGVMEPVTTVPSGSYTRFANGLMLQWGTGADTVNSSQSNLYGSTSGALFIRNVSISLPMPFASTDYYGTGQATVRGTVSIGGNSKTSTSFNIQIQHPTNGTQVPFQWHAIGRWFV